MNIEQLTKPILLIILVLIVNNAFSQSTLYVYDDQLHGGSASGKMGSKNGSGISIDANCKNGPLVGNNCLLIASDTSESWSGIFIQSSGNWRNDNGTYTDLSKYKYLVFSAKSSRDYKLAGIGMGEGEKEGAVSEKSLPLTTQWKRFVFELGDKRSNVNGLLFVVFEGKGDVYLDEVFYVDSTFIVQNSDVLFSAPAAPLSTDAYYVYSDKIDHGIPSGFTGEKDGASIKLDPDCRENPFYGNKCLKLSVNDTESWRGLYIFASGSWNPSDNQKASLPDLSQYDKLVFYGRSDKKNVVIKEVGVGENSSEKDDGARSEVYLELTPKWRKYEIGLKGLDLKGTNTLIMLILDVGTIYLDEVKYVKSDNKIQH